MLVLMVSGVVLHSQGPHTLTQLQTSEDSETMLGAQCENAVPDLGEGWEEGQGGLP